METERPFVAFSSRYGLLRGDRAAGREHWEARHASHSFDGALSFADCAPDRTIRCHCPGTPEWEPCCEPMTQEDLLCDRCRDHCWAIGTGNVRVRLVDVYPRRLDPPDRSWAQTVDVRKDRSRGYDRDDR